MPQRLGRAAWLLALLASCEGPAGPPGPAGPAGPQGEPGQNGGLDPSLSPLEKAVEALGGEDAVVGLDALSYSATGTRWIYDNGYRPGDAPAPWVVFDVEVEHDVADGMLRFDYVKTIDAFDRRFVTASTEIIVGRLGAVAGTESLLGAPAGEMTSDRWAATLTEHALLHPELLIRDVLLGGGVTDGGVAIHDGDLHHRLVIEGDVAPITLDVDASDGSIDRLSTVTNDYLRRDVAVDVYFLEWETTGALALPHHVVLAVDGAVVHEEFRGDVRVDPELDPSRFLFPADAEPEHDPALENVGRRSFLFNRQSAFVGLPLDGVQLRIRARELASGVFVLLGSTHNSLLVEQQDGLVLVEAPLYDMRSEALLSFVEENWPDKPLTHVISTHFHSAHSGGLRRVVADGVVAVVGGPSAAFFEQIFSAPSTILPDPIEEQGRAPIPIRAVDVGEELRLEDAVTPVRVMHLDTRHAADMVVVYLPGERILFESDLYSPGSPVQVPAHARDLLDFVNDAELEVDTIVASHGGLGTLDGLRAAAGP